MLLPHPPLAPALRAAFPKFSISAGKPSICCRFLVVSPAALRDEPTQTSESPVEAVPDLTFPFP